MAFIQMQEVTKVYKAKQKEVHALTGLNLSVEPGTVRALLGPNGAGKSTTVNILTTLETPTSGKATIDGLDVEKHAHQVRERIGVSGQYATIDEQLSASQNLRMIARLFHLPEKQAKARADELIEIFGLEKAAHRPVKGFSGGMRRRADLAASLVNDPHVLILDEPTTGLDPAARRALWGVIRERVDQGTTLLLTTQYLEEADVLADHISVIDQGRVIAEGTASSLKATLGGQTLTVVAAEPSEAIRIQHIMQDISKEFEQAILSPPTLDGPKISMQVREGTLVLERLLQRARSANIELSEAQLTRPSLDEVFLSLTNKSEESHA